MTISSQSALVLFHFIIYISNSLVLVGNWQTLVATIVNILKILLNQRGGKDIFLLRTGGGILA